MAIYILNLNERSKKAKALLQLIKEMASTEKSINIDANEGLGKLKEHIAISPTKKIPYNIETQKALRDTKTYKANSVNELFNSI